MLTDAFTPKKSKLFCMLLKKEILNLLESAHFIFVILFKQEVLNKTNITRPDSVGIVNGLKCIFHGKLEFSCDFKTEVR